MLRSIMARPGWRASGWNAPEMGGVEGRQVDCVLQIETVMDLAQEEGQLSLVPPVAAGRAEDHGGTAFMKGDRGRQPPYPSAPASGQRIHPDQQLVQPECQYCPNDDTHHNGQYVAGQSARRIYGTGGTVTPA